MKNFIRTVCLLLVVVFFQAGSVIASDKTIEVKITNLSAKIVLTPPIVAATSGDVSVFQLTEPASMALEMLAEGGSTDELALMFEDHDASVVQADDPILPGETMTFNVIGRGRSRISLASMLLPTNDGFVAMSGMRFKRYGNTTVYLSAYDAGTEMNDEDCANIPGPLSCGGGEGYNPEPGEGFVYPHTGTHGENGISAQEFSWADPVAKVTIRVVR